MAIHYIMPMAGRGSRFSRQGFDVPKPLIDIYGRPFFYWSTQSIRKFVDISSLDFVVLQEHVDDFNIDKKIKSFFPEARMHILSEVTEGAVVTSLKGIVDITDEDPVLFNDSDHLFKASLFESFCQKADFSRVDGILLTFPSNERKYSFVGKDKFGNVIRTAEKEVISDEAICGCYYFKNKDVFNNAANEYLHKCNYSEFFMSGVYNIMLEHGMTVKSMMTDFHIPFGTPEEYAEAQNDTNYEVLI